MRPDCSFTEDEAKLLDLCLVLHAEHGGGNNSAFTCRVVSSSGSDTYSAIASAICSLKGPKHGGANIKVQEMFDYVKQGVNDWNDDDEVTSFLERLIRGEEGDHSGLIYGMGHAIYTLSDPRAVMLKHYAMNLARGTEFEREFELLQSIERLSPAVFARYKQNDKNICANVDLYSGLVYRMLGIPTELIRLFSQSRESPAGARTVSRRSAPEKGSSVRHTRRSRSCVNTLRSNREATMRRTASETARR